MAFSQKYSGKVFVPWFNNSEWQFVYNNLRTNTSQSLSTALKVLKIWKTRTPLLSAGIEGTMILLESLSYTSNHSEVLVQIYAVSLLRFFNLCATNSDRQGTFQKTAQKNDLPKWLIDIRHDIAHGHKLPSKCILELALQQSLQWLIEKYWEAQDKILDYIVAESSQNSELVHILSIYIYFVVSSFYKQDLDKLNNDYFETVNDLIAKKYRIKNILNSHGIIAAIEELVRQSFQTTQGRHFFNEIEMIVTENALLRFTSEYSDEENAYSIPISFRNLWTNLFNIIASNNLLYQLINKLFDYTNNNLLAQDTRLNASLWIQQIFQGLNKLKILDSFKNNPKYEKITDSSVIISNFEEKYPEYKDSICFKESSFLEGLVFKSFEEKILSCPNAYTLNYLENVLKYNENSITFIEDIKCLVRNFTIAANGEIRGQSKIFTLNDIPYNIPRDEHWELQDFDMCKKKINDCNTNNRWTEIKDKMSFDKCPLGVLPKQGREKNSLIEF